MTEMHHTPIEHPCPICHQELFTDGFYVEQVDDGCGGFTDMHVACVPPRRRS